MLAWLLCCYIPVKIETRRSLFPCAELIEYVHRYQQVGGQTLFIMFDKINFGSINILATLIKFPIEAMAVLAPCLRMLDGVACLPLDMNGNFRLKSQL